MTSLEIPLITKPSILNECKFPWINEVKEIVGFEPIFIGCSLTKGCANNCSYCVDENTLILMEDLTQKPIKHVTVGETVIGMIKDPKTGHLKFKKSEVLAKWFTNKYAYKITLVDSTDLICSSDHRWYVPNRLKWAYTIGSMAGKNRRPYLTTNNQLMKICGNTTSSISTDEYMAGYLAGMILGDGHLAKYTHKRKDRDYNQTRYHFRLVLKDIEAIQRTKDYLEHFKILVFNFKFKNGSKPPLPGIRTDKKNDFYKIQQLIELKDNLEFQRGFVAGFFDSEGCFSRRNLRIFNTDSQLIDFLNNSLKKFNFDFTIEERKRQSKNVYSTRISGGLSEILRFFFVFQPVISRKKNIEEIGIKNSVKIRSINSLNKKIRMVDITTSTENFIANGILSHNCWVKYFYEKKNYINWGPKSGVFHKIEFCKNALDLLVKELPFLPSNAVIIASNMTDPFPDIFFESPTYFQIFKQWLQLLRNNWVLFITKNAKIIRYLDFFNPERHIIGLSITGRLSSKEKAKYEPNSSQHLTRIVTLSKAKKLGYKIFASIEPPLKPTPEIVQDLINYNLDSATMVCGLANYELETLWTKEDYIRFYDETMLLKEKYDLKLSWKADALNQINAWKAKEDLS